MPDVERDAEPAVRARRSPDPARSRLWRALVKPTRGQLIVAVLLAVVGFAAVTQVRTNTVDDTYAGLREQDLIDVLDGLAGHGRSGRRPRSSGSRRPATTCSRRPASREAALEAARDEADDPVDHRPGPCR